VGFFLWDKSTSIRLPANLKWKKLREDHNPMVWNGKITDVKTIIGILWVERHYRDSLF
jgi:hypothetical protein